MFGVPTRRGFIFSPMPARRALVVVNDRSRLAGRHGWRDAVDCALAAHMETAFVFPSSAAETSRLARDASAEGCDLVVAAGGDGTVNAVASGLLGTTCALGILPLGTANDLARELGVPRDLEGAARRLVEGEARLVDVVDVNGRPFLGVGGLALASQSALSVTRMKERSPLARSVANLVGSSVYRLAATANLLGRWRISDAMRLEYRSMTNGAQETRELRVAAMFVANHRTTGGGLVLPVEADPRDGAFELCLVPERNRLSLTLSFGRLSAGVPLPTGVIVPIRTTHATIDTSFDDAFVADGELLASGRHFELSVRPRALSVIA